MEKEFAQAMDDLEGIALTNPKDALEDFLGRECTAKELKAFEDFLEEYNFRECSCCGWWQQDNEGESDDMCWRCAEAEKEDEDF